MKICVLGPVVVSEGSEELVLSAAKQRKILALLLMNSNRFVSVDSLIREVWTEDPPKTALSTLQTYILKIRRAFAEMLRISAGDACRRVIETRSNGYMLRVDANCVDLNVYEEMVSAARKSISRGDLCAAADLYSDSLDLWTGPAFADIVLGTMLEPEVSRLEESRLGVYEDKISIELCLGRYREVLSELKALVSQHRLHEGLRAQYMLALHRSGRRSESLEAFHELRQELSDELGIDPSSRMHRLYQKILRDEVDDIEFLRPDFIAKTVGESKWTAHAGRTTRGRLV